MNGTDRPETAVDRPGYLIKRAQAALHAEMGGALHGLGATISQYAVLTALSEEPGLSNAELARRAFITPQSMNENLRDLEQRGWVVRTRHPWHGRILQAELTDLGRATLEACDEATTGVEERMLAPLGSEQRSELVATLRACIDALSPRTGPVD